MLGAAGKPERDLKLAALAADGVPVLRRRGGGGAVVLTPGQVVLALVTEVASDFGNREYARKINEWVIEALGALGVNGLEQRGITDLALRGRKVLGTSIYRSRRVLFYQASLLVANDVSVFEPLPRASRTPSPTTGGVATTTPSAPPCAPRATISIPRASSRRSSRSLRRRLPSIG